MGLLQEDFIGPKLYSHDYRNQEGKKRWPLVTRFLFGMCSGGSCRVASPKIERIITVKAQALMLESLPACFLFEELILPWWSQSHPSSLKQATQKPHAIPPLLKQLLVFFSHWSEKTLFPLNICKYKVFIPSSSAAP